MPLRANGGRDPGVKRELRLVIRSGRGRPTLYFPEAGELRRCEVDSASRLRRALAERRAARNAWAPVAEVFRKYHLLRVLHVLPDTELLVAVRNLGSVASLATDTPVFNSFR